MYIAYILCIYRFLFGDIMTAVAQLPIRVEQNLKDAFIATCKTQDSTASQELRKFMREYIKKHGQQDLFASKK